MTKCISKICHHDKYLQEEVFRLSDTIKGSDLADLIKAYPAVRGDLTDCLIGDLSKDFSDLFDAVSKFAKLPPELAYGEVLS